MPALWKKILSFLLSLFLLSVIVFYAARLAPGDPLVSYYGERAEKMTPQEREWAEEKLGLDAPLYVQYIRWFLRALKGDFGVSYKYKTAVTAVIGERVGNTLRLGGTAFVLLAAGALALGLLCARLAGRWPDRLLCQVGTAISVIPEFWLSLVLILAFAVGLRWLPGSGAYCVGNREDAADRLTHLILPVTAAVAGHLWYYAFLVRNRFLEEVRCEYVLLARAKGLGRGTVLCRHCLPNMLPSYVSVLAVGLPHILGGTYVIEVVFSYPGLGSLAYESARYKDYNLLMLLCLLSGAITMLGGLLAQAVNERIDPRIRETDMILGPEVKGHG